MCKKVSIILLFLSGTFTSSLAYTAAIEKDTVIEQEKSEELANPILYTEVSIKRGKRLFLTQCAVCHDRDGKARSAVMASAADLTNPSSWKYGAEDREIFNTVYNGAGNNMPPFQWAISNKADIWHLVNFVKSLGPNPPQFAVEQHSKEKEHEQK